MSLAVARRRPAPTESLVGSIVGPAIAGLPRVVRRTHAGSRTVTGRGVFVLEQSSSCLGRFVAHRMGLPRAEGRAMVVVRVERPVPGVERWHRDFAGEAVDSVQHRDGDHLVERIGPFALRFVVTADDGCLRFTHVRTDVVVGRLRCLVPRWAGPVVDARVGSVDRRRLDVDVVIRSPAVGLLFAYRGHLRMEVQS